jgi:hypothetical protein
MVSYRVSGMTVGALYDALHQRHITVKRTSYNAVYGSNAIAREGVDVIRLSTHFYNTEPQIDRLATALAEILGGGTAVGSTDEARPARLRLEPNAPNPFNGATTIRYHLPADGQVQIAVLDGQGQIVDVLTDAWQRAGAHELQWTPARRATGVYYCRMVAGRGLEVRKMLLLR